MSPRPSQQYAEAVAAEAALAQPGNTHPLHLAEAAWNVACAANEWVRPDLVEPAVERARLHFSRLGDPGLPGLAACTWQLNALPWTRPNFRHSAAALEQALASLEKANIPDFAAGCRLSLAFAQAVLWQFDEAAANVALCQTHYASTNDEANLLRCLLGRASILRRQSHFEDALACLQTAETGFNRLGLTVDLAKAYFQIGHCRWQAYTDPAAITILQQAAQIFQEYDIPLWFAQCQGALASIYHFQGELDQASDALAQGRYIYGRFPQIHGLHADNLVESGTLALLYADYDESLAHFRQAERLYDAAGVPPMKAIATMYQGEVYSRLGRYQQALPYFEQAYETFKAAGSAARLIECAKNLAQLWLKLGRPDQAATYLDTAAEQCQLSRQPAYIAEVHYLQAETAFRRQDHEAALTLYEQALTATQTNGLLPEIALAHRLLGEALCFLGRPQEAASHLQTAVAVFAEQQLPMELAASQVALGRCYSQIGQASAARTAYQQAWEIAHNALPDTSWQAAAGLATLASAESNQPAALSWYEKAIHSLARVRRDFWQPSLVGAYLRRPLEMLAQGISTAAQFGSPSTLLRFVEESKAQTTAVQLNQANWATGRTRMAATVRAELVQLKAKVEWLYEQRAARLNFSAAPLRAPAEAGTLHQLRQQTRAYETALSRLERDSLANDPAALLANSFDLDAFRAAANAHLGRPWLAINYHLAGPTLTVAILTPAGCFTYQHNLAGPTYLLLTTLARGSQQPQALDDNQLTTLGRALLPPFVQEQLDESTYLLIAPHRQLHRLPWPALRLDSPGSPTLVERCIPVVTPSLQTLHLLWQRPAATTRPVSQPKEGLLLAISRFAHDRHFPLPAVPHELDQLQTLSPTSLSLCEQDASWSACLSLVSPDAGLSAFPFLHVASHAFADPISGRASGIAFYDQDIWLDQLWELAPLPALVTLSACSGAHSLTHEGDEHVGLAMTCLAAGAQRVIASLWPVADPAAADLMVAFYRHYINGRPPAESLCLAQRQMIPHSHHHTAWSGFLCLGIP